MNSNGSSALGLHLQRTQKSNKLNEKYKFDIDKNLVILPERKENIEVIKITIPMLAKPLIEAVFVSVHSRY